MKTLLSVIVVAIILSLGCEYAKKYQESKISNQFVGQSKSQVFTFFIENYSQKNIYWCATIRLENPPKKELLEFTKGADPKAFFKEISASNTWEITVPSGRIINSECVQILHFEFAGNVAVSCAISHNYFGHGSYTYLIMLVISSCVYAGIVCLIWLKVIVPLMEKISPLCIRLCRRLFLVCIVAGCVVMPLMAYYTADALNPDNALVLVIVIFMGLAMTIMNKRQTVISQTCEDK